VNAPQQVVFGQNPNQAYHAFRRTDAVGLDRNAVMQTVQADLGPALPLPFPAPGNAVFIGIVWVAGVRLRYHAFPIDEGTVNVGSIRPLL
jgi:filamentous hemagglutinin